MDQRVHEAHERDQTARGQSIVPRAVTPNGPTLQDVKRAQRATSGAVDLAKEALAFGIEKAAASKMDPVDRLIDKFAAARHWPALAIKMTKEVLEWHVFISEYVREQASAVDAAARRDALNLVILDLAGSALDAGYAAHAKGERAGSREIARSTHNWLQRLPPDEYLALIRQARTSALDGVRAANDRKLSQPADLTAALAHDENFKLRFESDCAFRHGVLSALHVREARP